MASSPAHGIHYTVAEYLALEASSNVKHEYLEGQIYAMTGARPSTPSAPPPSSGSSFPS